MGWFYSCFIDTTQIFNPNAGFQLICSMMFLACSMFQIDLVKCTLLCFVKRFKTQRFQCQNSFIDRWKKIILFLATWTHWLQYNSFDVGSNGWHVVAFHLLLLWENIYRKLFKNYRLLVWIGLAQSTGWFAKILHFYDWKCKTTTLLLWIRNLHIKFGNFY